MTKILETLYLSLSGNYMPYILGWSGLEGLYSALQRAIDFKIDVSMMILLRFSVDFSGSEEIVNTSVGGSAGKTQKSMALAPDIHSDILTLTSPLYGVYSYQKTNNIAIPEFSS